MTFQRSKETKKQIKKCHQLITDDVSIFHFQHILNRLLNNCMKIYWSYISSSWNMRGFKLTLLTFSFFLRSIKFLLQNINQSERGIGVPNFHWNCISKPIRICVVDILYLDQISTNNMFTLPTHDIMIVGEMNRKLLQKWFTRNKFHTTTECFKLSRHIVIE